VWLEDSGYETEVGECCLFPVQISVAGLLDRVHYSHRPVGPGTLGTEDLSLSVTGVNRSATDVSFSLTNANGIYHKIGIAVVKSWD
jgi:hypothetical protein